MLSCQRFIGRLLSGTLGTYHVRLSACKAIIESVTAHKLSAPAEGGTGDKVHCRRLFELPMAA